jgi:hypothetical protein
MQLRQALIKTDHEEDAEERDIKEDQKHDQRFFISFPLLFSNE